MKITAEDFRARSAWGEEFMKSFVGEGMCHSSWSATPGTLGSNAHFVGRRLVLVLLPLLRHDIWGATFERDVEFVGHRLIRLLFRLLALQSSNLVKGLRAWTARHRAHKLNVHSKVDTNKLILVQISVAVHALYTEERPWTRFKLLGRAGFIVINFIRLAFILVIVVTICSGFHRLGRRRI